MHLSFDTFMHMLNIMQFYEVDNHFRIPAINESGWCWYRGADISAALTNCCQLEIMFNAEIGNLIKRYPICNCGINNISSLSMREAWRVKWMEGAK